VSGPSDEWEGVAQRDWKHCLVVPGADALSEVNLLDQADDGTYTWARESVYRTPTGVYLFVRAARTDADPLDTVTVVSGADEAELVTAIRAQLGMPPGRVEVLGRAGIEIGLAPDDEIEGDELEGPGPD